jgi:hypothetical protein
MHSSMKSFHLFILDDKDVKEGVLSGTIRCLLLLLQFHQYDVCFSFVRERLGEASTH